MTGKDMSADYFSRNVDAQQPSRTRTGFGVKAYHRSRKLKVVDFELYKGEVLVLRIAGAGRTELFKALFGAEPMTQGNCLNGKTKIQSTFDASRRNHALPEDRKVEGLILQMDLENNITIPSLKTISNKGLINKKKKRTMAKDYLKQLLVKCTGPNQIVNNLSGGNQQKVVFAKWLAAHPKVLLLDDPTRGVDVGAKQEIYGLIRELANNGIGVVFVSSELPELIGVCDRILVMRGGEIVGEVHGDEANENNLMLMAMGQ